MSSLPSKLKEFLMLAENCWKIEIKVFLYCAISHENYSLSHIFFPWLSFEYVEFNDDVHFVSFWLEILFWANFVQKIKTVSLSWNFAPDLFEYAELCRKYVVLTFSPFRPEKPFLGKSGQKNRNCQFKLKFGTKTNLNMWNSIMMFTLSVFDHKYLYWANLV